MTDRESSGVAPRVAVCVVTFNSAPLIPDLVDSLPAGMAGIEWDLIVADNASSDGTAAEVRRCAPWATVVETGGNLGYAAGINRAVSAAGTNYDAYLLLNADVRLSAGCVLALVKSLSERVGIVVPRLIDGHGQLIWSMRREPTLLRAWANAILGAERAGRIAELGEVVTDPSLYVNARATDWAEGSTQLVSARCWQRCGEWDESYFLYSEETEYHLRARDLGLVTLFQPSAVATHLEGDSAASPRLWSLLVINRVRLYSRRHNRVATCAFWAASLAREASRALLGKETSRQAVRDLCRPRRLRQPPGPAWVQEAGR